MYQDWNRRAPTANARVVKRTRTNAYINIYMRNGIYVSFSFLVIYCLVDNLTLVLVHGILDLFIIFNIR